MYGSLSLIIHAPGNVTYRAGERNNKISSRPYFSEVSEQALLMTIHEVFINALLCQVTTIINYEAGCLEMPRAF